MASDNPTNNESAGPADPPVPTEQVYDVWASLPRMFTSLRHRNYRLFFTGHSISMIGNWMQQPAMQWLLMKMTDSSGWLGTMGAIRGLPILLFSVLGGLISQRFQKRSILITTQLLLMVAPLVLAVALLLDYKAIVAWHLLAAAAIHGVVMAFDIPARQAFVVEVVGRNDLPNAIGLNSSLFNIARTLGPLFGGVLIWWLGSEHGAAACFALNGISFLALISALLCMRQLPLDLRELQHARKSRHPLGGLYYVWNSKPLRASMLLLAANSFFGWPLVMMLAAFAKNVYHREVGTFSGFVSIYGLGSLVGALLVAHLASYRKRQRLILAGLATFIVSGLVFTIVTDFKMAMIPIFLAGLGMMVTSSGMNSYVQMVVSNRFRGRVMGVYATFFAGMMPFGFLLTGWVAECWSLTKIVQLNLLALTCVAVCVWVYWRHLKAGTSATADDV